VDGTHFIAAEFIEGETLRERMMGARMQIGDVLNVAEQVACAGKGNRSLQFLARSVLSLYSVSSLILIGKEVAEGPCGQ
jgi:hypothetical protein